MDRGSTTSRGEGRTRVTVLVSPSKTQSCTRVKEPTHAIVKKPTHLMLVVIPKPRPVMANQNHQLGWKALVGPSSCWLQKEKKAKAVKAVAIISGESSRINRAWVSSPFSACP